MTRHQNAGQNRDKDSSENVAKLKYLGTTVIDQNMIHEEIKRRLNSGNACYHSAQNLLPSRLLSKILRIITHHHQHHHQFLLSPV
jgi:hypothetical protein